MKRNVNLGIGLLIVVLLLTPNVSFGADSEEKEFNKIVKTLEESRFIPEIETAVQSLVELKTITPDAKAEVLLRALRREIENPISLRATGFVKCLYRSAFIAIGDPAIPLLRKHLEDKDEGFRQEVAIILGYMKDKKVLPLLMDMATNAQEIVIRILSVMALGEMGDREAVPFLIDKVRKVEEEWEIRAEAAHALGDIGDKRAIPVLKEALKDDFRKPHLTEDSRDRPPPGFEDLFRFRYPVRGAAFSALRKMGVKVERVNHHDYIVIEE